MAPDVNSSVALQSKRKLESEGMEGGGEEKRTGASARPTDEIDNFDLNIPNSAMTVLSLSKDISIKCLISSDGGGMILTGDPDRRNAHKEFRTAMVQVVNSLYVKGIDDLSAWQNICKIMRVLAVPADSETCRKAMMRVH